MTSNKSIPSNEMGYIVSQPSEGDNFESIQINNESESVAERVADFSFAEKSETRQQDDLELE